MELRTGKRRVLLFLVAILPAAVLVGLAARVFRQEQELTNKRAADQRRDAVEQVRRELATKLEAIKFQEVNRLRDESFSRSRRYTPDSPVIFSLPVEQDHLVMPWEESKPETHNRDTRYPIEGEVAEYQAGDPALALAAYKKMLAAAQDVEERCESRLRIGRVLLKLSRRTDAAPVYRSMLQECDSVADADGMSLALYAAERLSSEQLDPVVARAFVLDRAALNRWWPPLQLYLMSSLVGGSALSDQLAETEQLIALAREFHGTSFLRSGWFAYGAEPWLVTVMSPMPMTTPVVLAVSSKKVAPPDAILVAGHSDAGTALGEGFMDVNVEWPATRFAPIRRTPVALYWAGFILVLSATGLAGYLLLRDLNREVQLANLRSHFVASVSHELKTPLTAIRMFAETLALGRLKNPDTSGEYLQTIVNESERLSRLVDNVLDFSRLERGEKSYRMQPVVLPEVVRASARAMQYPLAQQGFQLALSIDEEIPVISADADALEQAILNLLTNAMRYSGDCRDITLCLKRVESDAVIEVSDRGIGIPQHEHSHIFEKFYRVRSAATEAVAGAGLGLTLAMHIVNAHQGRIEVKSEIGAGSTFSVFLPICGSEALS